MAKNRYLPFGYCIRNGEYTVHEQEAEYIRMIYLAYVAGASYQSLAVKMQESGVRYHTDSSDWNKHMVKRILENERYTGTAEFPAILSKELFDRVMRLRESKRMVPKNPRKRKEKATPPLLPADQVNPVPNIKIIKLENQISRELIRPVLETERLRNTIFQLAKMKYEAYFHAQEIVKANADTGGVRFPTGSFVLNNNYVFIGTQYDITD